MKPERTSTMLLTVKNSDCPVARLIEKGEIDGLIKTLRLNGASSEHLIKLDTAIDPVELSKKNLAAIRLSDKYLWITSQSCNVCKILSKFPTVVDRVTYKDKAGVVVQKITVQGRFVPERILKEMKKQDLVASVIDTSNNQTARRLTQKQLGVLMRALRMGYLDDPKRASLMDIAKATGTTPSTVRRHLRAATKKVIEYYVESHPSVL
jgi:predicted DNA binding protein